MRGMAKTIKFAILPKIARDGHIGIKQLIAEFNVYRNHCKGKILDIYLSYCSMLSVMHNTKLSVFSPNIFRFKIYYDGHLGFQSLTTAAIDKYT